MTVNGRMWRAVAVLIFTGLILGFAAQGIGRAEEIRSVQGIVEYATKETLTVRNKLTNTSEVHNIVGVQIMGENMVVIKERGSALHGKRAEIWYRDARIESLVLFPPMPE